MLDLTGFDALEAFPDEPGFFSLLTRLTILKLVDCHQLKVDPDLPSTWKKMPQLTSLEITRCEKVKLGRKTQQELAPAAAEAGMGVGSERRTSLSRPKDGRTGDSGDHSDGAADSRGDLEYFANHKVAVDFMKADTWDKLEELTLDGTKIRLRNTNEEKRLSMAGVTCTASHAMAIVGLLANGSLATLDLTGSTSSGKVLKSIGSALGQWKQNGDEPLQELLAGGLTHSDGGDGVPFLLDALVSGACSSSLRVVDCSGQPGSSGQSECALFTSESSGVVPSLVSLMEQEGNSLKVLNLGGHGKWPAANPDRDDQLRPVDGLIRALNAECCVLEELDISESSLDADDARRLLHSKRIAKPEFKRLVFEKLNISEFVANLAEAVELKLNGENVGTADAVAISERIGMERKLERVDLSHTQCTGSALCLLGEGMRASDSPIEALRLEGMSVRPSRGAGELEPIEASLGMLVSGACKPTLQLVDLQSLKRSAAADETRQASKDDDGRNERQCLLFLEPTVAHDWDGAAGALPILCEHLQSPGNQLKTVILAGNGKWPAHGPDLLIQALKSPQCRLKHLDVAGGGLEWSKQHKNPNHSVGEDGRVVTSGGHGSTRAEQPLPRRGTAVVRITFSADDLRAGDPFDPNQAIFGVGCGERVRTSPIRDDPDDWSEGFWGVRNDGPICRGSGGDGMAPPEAMLDSSHGRKYVFANGDSLDLYVNRDAKTLTVHRNGALVPGLAFEGVGVEGDDLYVVVGPFRRGMTVEFANAEGCVFSPAQANVLVQSCGSLDTLKLMSWTIPVGELRTSDTVSMAGAGLTDADGAVVGALLKTNTVLTKLDLTSAVCSAEVLRFISEGLQQSKAPLQEVLLSGLKHATTKEADEPSVASRLEALVSAACRPSVRVVDCSGQAGTVDKECALFSGPDAGALPSLCKLLSSPNSLTTLRVGGNGTWPKGAGRLLCEAFRPPHCVVEELDLSGSASLSADAAELLQCRALRTLTLNEWPIPVTELRESEIVSTGGRVLDDADGSIVAALLKQNAAVTTLDLSDSELSTGAVQMISEGLRENRATPLAQLLASGIKHAPLDGSTAGADAAPSVAARLAMLVEGACRPSLQVVALNGQDGGEEGECALFSTADLGALQSLSRLMQQPENQLKRLRLGCNGTWPEAGVSTVLSALRSDACVLEHLDLGVGSSSKAESLNFMGREYSIMPPGTVDGSSEPQHNDPFTVPRGWRPVSREDAQWERIRLEVIGAHSWNTLIVCVTKEDPSQLAGYGSKQHDGGNLYTDNMTWIKMNEPGVYQFISTPARLLISRPVPAAVGHDVASQLMRASKKIKSLTLGMWEIPVDELLRSETISFGGETLGEGDGAIVADLLKDNTALSELNLSGASGGATALKLISEGVRGSTAPLAQLLAAEFQHAPAKEEEASVASRLGALVGGACRPSLVCVDLTGQKGVAENECALFEGSTGGGTLPSLCQLIGQSGNKLATMRLGANGTWPAGGGALLKEALGSASCVVEEVNMANSGLCAVSELADGLVAGKLRRLNLDGTPFHPVTEASHAAFSNLVSLSAFKQLESLSLVRCGLCGLAQGKGERSAKLVALLCDALRAEHSLTELKLNHNKLRIEDAQQLAAACTGDAGSRLVVDVSNNAVSERSADFPPQWVLGAVDMMMMTVEAVGVELGGLALMDGLRVGKPTKENCNSHSIVTVTEGELFVVVEFGTGGDDDQHLGVVEEPAPKDSGYDYVRSNGWLVKDENVPWAKNCTPMPQCGDRFRLRGGIISMHLDMHARTVAFAALEGPTAGATAKLEDLPKDVPLTAAFSLYSNTATVLAIKYKA